MGGNFNISSQDLPSTLSSAFNPPNLTIEEVYLNIKDGETLSYLGTPVFSDLLIKENEADEGIYMDTILIEVSQSKNIVTTAIEGRNGTIKEFIADGDFMINIKGAIVGNDGQYPLDLVNDLLSYCKRNVALEIVCPYVQLFDVYNIVITGYSFPQRVGKQNMQYFELTCLSDNPVELISNA